VGSEEGSVGSEEGSVGSEEGSVGSECVCGKRAMDPPSSRPPFPPPKPEL
jgi:hypothetical protein